MVVYGNDAFPLYFLPSEAILRDWKLIFMEGKRVSITKELVLAYSF